MAETDFRIITLVDAAAPKPGKRGPYKKTADQIDRRPLEWMKYDDPT